MGRFTDTKYSNTIDSLVKGTKDKINNPYYKFTDKKPTKVTYYKQNREKTTLDEASKDIYSDIGPQAPVKFNKINDFYIYGFEKINTSFNVEDFGLRADTISGTVIVLPNTIEPTEGDYFALTYLKEDLLFKVNSVSRDTLDDGANVYQIEYNLEKVDMVKDIEVQVVKVYRFVINNVGTMFNPIVLDTTYDLISELDVVLMNLTSMYQIFFDKNVQNFVYSENGYYFYDPFLIEFMIRHKLMSYNPSQYVFVHHGTHVGGTFSFDYSRSIFSVLENRKEINETGLPNVVHATLIQEINSLFTTRLHPYYAVQHSDRLLNDYMNEYTIFPAEVNDHILSGEYFIEDDKIVYNLLIAFFKEDEDYITGNLMNMVKKIGYMENKEYYYLIPIYIFIINHFIESLMK